MVLPITCVRDLYFPAVFDQEIVAFARDLCSSPLLDLLT
jgi:hypothetical protein